MARTLFLLLPLFFLTGCAPTVNIYGVFVDPWIKETQLLLPCLEARVVDEANQGGEVRRGRAGARGGGRFAALHHLVTFPERRHVRRPAPRSIERPFREVGRLVEKAGGVAGKE